jgi:hypothetical protein
VVFPEATNAATTSGRGVGRSPCKRFTVLSAPPTTALPCTAARRAGCSWGRTFASCSRIFPASAPSGTGTTTKGAWKTVFVLPVGPQTVFPGGTKTSRIADLTDGTSNTVLVVTADDAHAVPWTRREDLRFDREHPSAGLARYPGGYLVGMGDGAVRFLSVTVDPKKLLPEFTPSGGEVVSGEVFAGE